ncbi:ABC transporter substrate-binding protein [Herbaspirillum sp. meg3]|uniref:ABC transporter substrate-binding protein n=1 Tax=Herbaspirillum sp. meg3 TaxID=2025949 RepID=UPI000B985E6F|nr:ABC transporter substrate-binding protein [Herbaspirillum sp. meg3]ASU39399.1 ABC transporter substrate-binding protein [Herbaspirillum sp. meg3]
MFVLTAMAQAQNIRIGEINSYSGVPQSSQSYHNGAELAVAEINAAGGVLGRNIDLISRDDTGIPDEAVRHAEQLVKTDKVDVLSGSMLSNVALAVSRVAASEKKLFLVGDALSDAITLDKGNRYTFRLRPSTYMQAAMLAEAAARLPVRRWAIIAPNYEYGQSAVSNFKLLLKERRPDVEFVAEQWPALGKLKAADAVKALRQARPDAIFNVTFGTDLQQFVEEGSRQGLFASSTVYSMSAGEALGDMQAQYEAVRNWVVLGYPTDQIATAEHQRFREAYLKRYNEKPHQAAIFGYSTIMALVGGIKKAGSTDSDKLVIAMRGLSMDSPVGPIVFRSQDQQSSMGAFVGTLVYKDGRSPSSDWRYLDGIRYMPDETYVKGRRPASAMR